LAKSSSSLPFPSSNFFGIKFEADGTNKNREPLRWAELIRVAQYAFIFFLGDLAGPP